jgi:hypothetical protein
MALTNRFAGDLGSADFGLDNVHSGEVLELGKD